ncbi:CrcB family protein, partial [Acinetobacter baumannii]|nr:fluoride efflux transporter CrcB [Acinetobacter baumannii]
LTTFSTFSIEIVTLLQSGKWGMAMLAISIHLIGSLIFTCLGLATYYWVAGN